jgi:hypothetical protein
LATGDFGTPADAGGTGGTGDFGPPPDAGFAGGPTDFGPPAAGAGGTTGFGPPTAGAGDTVFPPLGAPPIPFGPGAQPMGGAPGATYGVPGPNYGVPGGAGPAGAASATNFAAAPGAPGGAPSQILCTVGDISVTATEILLPNGRAPLRGTTWIVNPQVNITQKTPTWAVVMAIVGFFLVCVLSLFFLLAKERTVQGFVQVSVQGPGLMHTTQMGVASEVQMRDIEGRVNYIRNLVAQLG